MRGMLAPIPCLVAPLALAGSTGRVVAVALTTAGRAAEISARLRRGFIREPSVAVEIESYRPSFILGEVAAPGQYPYLPNMTARFVVPSGTPLSPGDTVLVGERGF
jgi:polysaccharide export outer membrane protein